jgi:hypothetical protein
VAAVLIECQLIVSDKDESEWWAIRDRESIWAWEFASIIVPLVESFFVRLSSFDKRTPISHHILPLVPIDIHTVPDAFVSPVKFFQPSGGSLRRN